MPPRRYRENIEWLQIFKELETRIVSRETKLPQDEARRALTKTHLILTSQKAKEAGFIDEIIQTEGVTVS